MSQGESFPLSPVSLNDHLRSGFIPVRLPESIYESQHSVEDVPRAWMLSHILKRLDRCKPINLSNFIPEIKLDWAEGVNDSSIKLFYSTLLFGSSPMTTFVSYCCPSEGATPFHDAEALLMLPFDVIWSNLIEPSEDEFSVWISHDEYHTQEPMRLKLTADDEYTIKRALEIRTSLINTGRTDIPTNPAVEQIYPSLDPLPLAYREVIGPSDATKQLDEHVRGFFSMVNEHRYDADHVTESLVKGYIKSIYHIDPSGNLSLPSFYYADPPAKRFTKFNDYVVAKIHDGGFVTKDPRPSQLELKDVCEKMEKISSNPVEVKMKIDNIEQIVKNILALMKSGERMVPESMPSLLPISQVSLTHESSTLDSKDIIYTEEDLQI